MSNFIRITPFMIVPDLHAALHFFVDILGFTLWLKADNYAYVQRETAAFRLLEQKDFDASYKRRYAYYIDVNDVDALYAELQLRLATLPDHHHHTPHRQALRAARNPNMCPGRQSPRLRPVDPSHARRGAQVV
jgi:catechol 2,3-dioxygenase-like lactoylglutathione lyase family enzyme